MIKAGAISVEHKKSLKHPGSFALRHLRLASTFLLVLSFLSMATPLRVAVGENQADNGGILRETLTKVCRLYQFRTYDMIEVIEGSYDQQ